MSQHSHVIIASSDLQLYYTVNMAVMIYDFIKEIEEAEVRDRSIYAELQSAFSCFFGCAYHWFLDCVFALCWGML